MRRWDFDARPYRPVEKVARQVPEQPDVFMDAMGRLWYAATPALMELLPSDPVAVLKIPSEFWPPDVARKQAADVHSQRKRDLENDAAERRWAS